MPAKKYFCADDVTKEVQKYYPDTVCVEFDNSSHIKLHCNKCGYEWWSRCTNIKKRGCSRCSKHIIISTLEDANKFLDELGITKIRCVEYCGSKIGESVFQCQKCGIKFVRILSYFNDKTNDSEICACCETGHCCRYDDYTANYMLKYNGINNVIAKQVKLSVFDFYSGDELIYTGQTKDLIKYYKTLLDRLNLNGEIQNNKEYIQNVLDSLDIGFECISPGSTIDDIGLYKCKVCGELKETSFISLIRGRSTCKKCRHQKVIRYKSKEDVNKWLEEHDVPIVCVEYEGTTHGKSKFKCNKCGREFTAPFNKIKTENQRCPNCNKSFGESLLQIYFEKHNIEYIPQYTDPECRYKKPLHFDFYIPSKNLLIEFQGRQHQKPSEKFGGQKEFDELQIRDQIKRDFCKERNVPLLEIWYYQISDLNNILDNIFAS